MWEIRWARPQLYLNVQIQVSAIWSKEPPDSPLRKVFPFSSTYFLPWMSFSCSPRSSTRLWHSSSLIQVDSVYKYWMIDIASQYRLTVANGVIKKFGILEKFIWILIIYRRSQKYLSLRFYFSHSWGIECLFS